MPMRETQNFARPLQRVEPLLRFANSFENIRQGFCTSSLDQSNSKLVRVSTNIEETSEELPRNFRYAPSAPWLDRPSWKTWGICTQRAGKLYKARSRLYRSQILQVNMRLKPLAEIYTMHSFAQLCNLNFLSNFAKKFAEFCKIGG